jgi:hypothetical protein
MSQKGNEILLRARQQFRNTRTVETLKKIPVPEWETDVFYWPTRDMAERVAIEEHIRISGDRTLADLRRFHMAQVTHRTRDEFGNRLFSDSDVEALADTHPEVIQRVSLAMGMGDGLTLEVAEKN